MTNSLLDRYRASGRAFTAGGIGSFVLDDGPRDGEPVVCVHGVPASAYLYRKVVPALAARGLRGIAVDFATLAAAPTIEAWSRLLSGVQVDAPAPQLGIDPELAAVAPHLRVAEDFQHN